MNADEEVELLRRKSGKTGVIAPMMTLAADDAIPGEGDSQVIVEAFRSV